MPENNMRMANQLTTNAEALRLFFTDDVYLVKSTRQTTGPVEVPVVEAEIAAVERVIEHQVSDLPKKILEFEYLGKNQRGILILVNDETNKVSSTEGTELLRNIVKAIGLTNNDFALVNYANYQNVIFDELRQFFNCSLVLSFGVEPKHLALADQALHQLCTIHATRFVFTTNLHLLAADQAGKKALWATLQTLKND